MPENEDLKWNEAGGRLFEFLSIEALSILFPENTIEWQPQQLPTMIIQPDIAIRDKTGTLAAIGLSGHATAKNSAGMKVDRSIEELFEAKESLSSQTIVFSIIWHSPNGWSEGQLKRMDSAFDYNFVVYRECKEIWPDIVVEVNQLADEVKGADEPTCRSLVKASGLPLRLSKYMAGLVQIVQSRQEANKDIWKSVRESYRSIESYKSNIEAHIKEALTPLLWMPETIVDAVLDGKTIKRNDDSETFIRLGGAIPTTAGVKANAHITNLSNHYSRDIVKKTILQLQTAEGISSLLDSLKSKAEMQNRISRTEEAIHTRSLAQLCQKSFDKDDPDYTGRCWPFEICTTWIKLKVDNKFGLLEAQREVLGDTKTNYGWDPIVFYTEGYSDYLSEAEVSAICTYFEEVLASAKSISVEELNGSILTEARKEKANNPLQWIIRETLSHYGIEYDQKLSFQCIFAHNAGLGASSGRTTFQVYIPTEDKLYIIHALSAYSSTHKDVEFSGKTRLYRLINNQDVEIVYVLDGDKWPERTCYMFDRAGAKTVAASSFEKWVQKNLVRATD